MLPRGILSAPEKTAESSFRKSPHGTLWKYLFPYLSDQFRRSHVFCYYGTLYSGNIKSAIGLGIILYQGIGDTIRVSLTGAPLEEIKSAKRILKTLGLRKGGIEVVSCPTCGRTRIDLIGLANKVEAMVQDIPLDQSSGHGLRSQWTGRSEGSGYRNRRWSRCRTSDQKRRNRKESTGGRTSGYVKRRTAPLGSVRKRHQTWKKNFLTYFQT